MRLHTIVLSAGSGCDVMAVCEPLLFVKTGSAACPCIAAMRGKWLSRVTVSGLLECN